MKKITLLALTFLSAIAVAKAQDVTLPIDFEGDAYEITNFDGGDLTVVSNSQSTDANSSANVGQMIKGAGQTWGGAYITLTSPVDFSAGNEITMKVFSPRADVPVLLKLEDGESADVFAEVTVNTTVANEWETLTFDFSDGIGATYTKVVLIFENGTAGDGSADWTFLVDDIQFASEDGGGEETALSLNEFNNVKVFSNNGMLHINGIEELVNGQVEVFSITGQKVFNSTIANSSELISLTTKGLVIVRVSDANNNVVMTKKLIVNY